MIAWKHTKQDKGYMEKHNWQNKSSENYCTLVKKNAISGFYINFIYLWICNWWVSLCVVCDYISKSKRVWIGFNALLGVSQHLLPLLNNETPSRSEASSSSVVTSRHLTSPAGIVKMATTGTLRLRRISASVSVLLGLLSALNTGNCDEQVPLILWTSEGWELVVFLIFSPHSGDMMGNGFISLTLAKYVSRRCEDAN